MIIISNTIIFNIDATLFNIINLKYLTWQIYAK